MLPGLIPILVFILVDEFWSTEASLIIAVAVGLVQLTWGLIREKRFDKFVLFDTALLVAMGGISIALNNELFFKLKPAFINLILCVLMGLSAFSSRNILLLYTQRYMGEMQLPEGAEKAFQRMMKYFFWAMVAYTLLIVYSAFYMSKEAWAFISGALLYILFGIFFLYQFISSKLKSKHNPDVEWLPLVDESGKIIGKTDRLKAHKSKQMLHPVVHLHLLNSRGDIYLQKRPDNKPVQPGKWDTAVGGHVAFGESIDQALLRETAEELNINGLQPRLLERYKWESEIESELVFTFIAIYNATPQFNRNEVAAGRFWSQAEIRQNLGKGVFTPNFEFEFPRLLKAL